MKTKVIALLAGAGMVALSVTGALAYINNQIDGGTVLVPAASKKQLPPVFMAPMQHACFPTDSFFSTLKAKKVSPKMFVTGEDEHGELVFVAEFPAILDNKGKVGVPPEVMVYTTMQEGTVICLLTALPIEGVDVHLKEMIQFFDPLKGYKAWSPSGGPAHEAKFEGWGGNIDPGKLLHRE